MTSPVALITGSAKRVGACIARYLHHRQFRVIIHYHHSQQAAQQLVDELNQIRSESATCISADLTDLNAIETLAQQAQKQWSQIDLLVNNASSFYPTPFEQADAEQWQQLMASNAQAPYFLSQALLGHLRQQQGNIINIADLHGQRPMKQHSIYCMSKAALIMMTQSLAQELAPDIRVNAVAPGMMLAPDDPAMATPSQKLIHNRVPLQRVGQPQDIAETVYFLSQQQYTTGQIMNVDGGRSLTT